MHRRTEFRALLLAVTALCGCGGSSSHDGPLPQRVLLISLDTLRADHTGFGGYHKPTTPFLDSLAEKGVVFENHFSNSNCTLPSHATMLTGLHYPSHGVVPPKKPTDPVKVLPESVVTLAERFQEEGYYTTAFTSHGAWLNEEHGFDQGFDHFVSDWDNDADKIIEDYLDHLDDQPQENSFTFLHFFDIHSDNAQKGPCLPYQSNPKLVKEFAGPTPDGFTGCSTTPGLEKNCSSKYLGDLSRKVEPLPDDHLEFIVGLYDAGIRLLDEKLRGLFEELEERGHLENTLIVITSDHGESFFEHQTMLHDTHHDEVARVPLIVVLPETSGVAPRRIKALTQSTDLAPTILDLCGLEPIGQLASLAPAIMLNEEPEDGLVLFHGHILIGRDDVSEYKFVKVGGKRSPVFFDRNEDPLEQHNLLEGPGYKEDQRERLLLIYQSLNELFKDCKDINKMLLSMESGEEVLLSAERIKELEELGYMGGGSSDADADEDDDDDEADESGDSEEVKLP